MYNRYIPQPDGSYRRSTHQEPPRPHRPQRPYGPPRPEPKPEPPKEESCPPPKDELEAPCPVEKEEPHQDKKEHSIPHKSPQGQNITSFLRQLLPKDFDTADLLIVLLLILMAGDSPEDQNHALLTLALYLFM